jgi:hypothetical protein
MAGRGHDLGVSLYYSHIDWHDWDAASKPRSACLEWDQQNLEPEGAAALFVRNAEEVVLAADEKTAGHRHWRGDDLLSHPVLR